MARRRTIDRLLGSSSKFIILLIALAIGAVAFVLIFNILNTPERITKGKIEGFAREYYEEYFYEDFIATSSDTDSLLASYTEKGFSPVPLRQLLLFDGGRHYDEQTALSEYCDLNATKVTFYPESPYGKTNYRMDIKFACEF